jgi:dTDP-4-dehydrorhamnose reductase
VPAIVTAARAHHRLRIIADRFGRPTFAGHLAAALIRLADAPPGIYHYADHEPTTWFGVATAIVEALLARDAIANADLQAITSAEWPQVAARPATSVLDTQRVVALGIEVPPWRPALAAVVARMRLS